ncbi:hypothetical protein [Microseira sp. BLCC-F43]|jgi:hypothetical protein|uniref:hypothetical protein n=1 Tax=Microseira sp. BLCC-F43 TaxID=3153602 RepID=UPI0035BB0C97
MRNQLAPTDKGDKDEIAISSGLTLIFPVCTKNRWFVNEKSTVETGFLATPLGKSRSSERFEPPNVLD